MIDLYWRYSPLWNGGPLWKIKKEKILLNPRSDTSTIYVKYLIFPASVHPVYRISIKSAIGRVMTK